MAASWYSVFGTQEIKVVKETDSIYVPFNKYGFMIDINHPVVNEVYREYKKEIGELLFPITNEQRFEFEKRVMNGYYPQLEKYLAR